MSGEAGRRIVRTDSHAHLSSVADELGPELVRSVFEAYAEDPECPLIVDIGTESEDLSPRLRRIADIWNLAPRPAHAAAGAVEAAFTAHAQARLPRFVKMTAGLWPSAEALAEPAASVAALNDSIDAFEAAGGSCFAIGECGLDYHHMNAPAPVQAELFKLQIELAARRALPLIVHSREAFDATLALAAWARGLDAAALFAAAAFPEPPGKPVALLTSPLIIHCFGYGPEQARAFLDLDCYISFAGNLSYKNAAALRESCALVPQSRLLLETDAPYMNPQPRRGKASSPLDIVRTYECAAALRCLDERRLARLVDDNMRRMINDTDAARHL